MHRINDVIQLWLGIQGENKSRTIEIDMTDWIVGMPNGSPSIWIKRPGDATPTATGATFDMVTNLLTWQPDEVDTYVAGEGTAEIRMTEGTVIKKTKEIRIAVSPAVTGGGTTLGSDWQSYINEVDRLKSLATAAATAAEASEEAAETAAEEAEEARDTAVSAKNAADASATAAAGSAETARQAAAVASSAATAAQGYKDQALSASGAAQTAQNQAEIYKSQASSSASNAQTAESHARTYANNASSSASQAQSSASNAAGSAATANSAATRAENARNVAEQAKAAAIEAKTAAVSAKNTAEAAETAAETAATAAAGSATAAAGSATSAAADAETAEDAKDAAVAAKTASEAARDAALTMIDDTAGAGDTDKVWSADKSATEVSDLNSAIDEKADSILKTIDTPASIITIEDGADDLPVKELKVAIEPVQGLHGYDSPWPAGGGKNLISDGTDTNNGYLSGYRLENTGGTAGSAMFNISEYFPVTANETYTFSQTIGNLNYCAICFYDSSKNFISGEYYLQRMSFQITVPETAAYARATYANSSGIETYGYQQFEKGNAASAWSPYSNICPISGYTGCNVTRTGKNLLRYPYHETTETKNGITFTDNGDGSVTLNGTSTARTDFLIISPNGIPHSLKNGEYKVTFEYMSGTINSTSSAAFYLHCKGDSSEPNYTNFPADDPPYVRSATIVNNVFYYMSIRVGTENVTFNNYRVRPMIIAADETDYSYEPYQGETYDITFPSEAGTDYGGELTINADGTGELVVEYKHDVFDRNTPSSSYARSDNITYMMLQKSIATGSEAYGQTPMTGDEFGRFSHGKWQRGGWGGWRAYTNSATILRAFILSTEFDLTTSEGRSAFWDDFEAKGQDLEVIYKLSNPIVYQLSVPQVRTLLGLNHIYADAGDIESITYPVDTATAIDNQTATTQSIIAGTDSSVATESHVVGDVFICDNKLYKAIDAIAVGESIIVGSNVVQTSIAELIVKGPRFVCNFGLRTNEYVELHMNGVCRAVAFVSGASAGRNGMIHAFSNASAVYAEGTDSIDNVSVSYNNTDRTVKIQNTGNDDIYVDVLKLYGDVTGQWGMPLSI